MSDILQKILTTKREEIEIAERVNHGDGDTGQCGRLERPAAPAHRLTLFFGEGVLCQRDEASQERGKRDDKAERAGRGQDLGVIVMGMVGEHDAGRRARHQHDVLIGSRAAAEEREHLPDADGAHDGRCTAAELRRLALLDPVHGFGTAQKNDDRNDGSDGSDGNHHTSQCRTPAAAGDSADDRQTADDRQDRPPRLGDEHGSH